MADAPEKHLEALGPRFMEGLKKRAEGRVDDALEIFQEVLRAEPRLAEPRMEIARVWLEMGKLEEAEAEAREAVRLLETGAQWTDELPENVVLALAWALLGEVLKERAQSDEVVFGDPEVFEALLGESRVAFARAAELDPTDSASWLNAQELGDRPSGEDGDGS
ncbi:MAG: tetratricopeptide repeat protein [Myxococcota bacterium]